MSAALLKPIPVFSLQCHKNVDLTLICLPTLLERCKDPIELIIHDDGTLTAEDCDRLRDKLGPIRIISKQEADDIVIPRLGKRARCVAFRRELALALKLLDPAMITDGGPFMVCDSDMMFLRDFEKFDRRTVPGEDLVFMKDSASCYTFSFLDRHFRAGRPRLADCVNSGLLYCTPRGFDLDYIDRLISDPQFSLNSWVAEQTMWAALAGRCSARYYDPEQVDFPKLSYEYRREWLALHFISPLRYVAEEPGYLDNLRENAARYQAAGTATLRTLPTASHNAAQDLFGRVRRRIQPSYIGLAMKRGPVPIAG